MSINNSNVCPNLVIQPRTIDFRKSCTLPLVTFYFYPIMLLSIDRADGREYYPHTRTNMITLKPKFVGGSMIPVVFNAKCIYSLGGATEAYLAMLRKVWIDVGKIAKRILFTFASSLINYLYVYVVAMCKYFWKWLLPKFLEMTNHIKNYKYSYGYIY